MSLFDDDPLGDDFGAFEAGTAYALYRHGQDRQAERDAGAQRLADEFREQVICEFWSFANPQDDLNRGWACDGAIQPSVRKENA